MNKIFVSCLFLIFRVLGSFVFRVLGTGLALFLATSALGVKHHLGVARFGAS